MQRHPDSGLVIDDIVLIILLFANDMVIFGKTPQELPYNLNNLQSYCTKWGLKVNTDKTNVMGIRKGDGLHHNESWTYNGVVLDIVDEFN